LIKQYSKDPAINRSLHYSVRDAVAYSVMSGGAETYFSAFALFLKASAPQIALLATLPNLLGALAQPLSAWIGHRIGRRKPIIMAGAFLQALVWLPFLALPFLDPVYVIPLLVTLITWYQASGNLSVPQWISLMGDLVPERKRGRYFARRTRLATLTSFFALVCTGIVLHVFDKHEWTLYGFLLIFSIAMIARLISVFYLGKMHEPVLHPAAIETTLGRTWIRQARESGALRFTIFFALMQAAVAVASPFFAVYMLRDLEFTYLEFMINTGAAVLIQVLTLNYWGRIGDVMGNRLVLVSTGILIPVLPLLWLVSGNFWYLLAIQVIGGSSWAGFSLSASNHLYDLVPAAKRATYMAFQNLVVAAAGFLGSMLGASLSIHMPAMQTLFATAANSGSVLLWTFLASALLRMLVAAYFLPGLRDIRKPRRQMSTPILFYRITRFNAFSGLLYEIVSRIRR
jgi:MFS family permease